MAEAATLKPVPDSKDKGASFLPSAGELTGWIAKGTVPAGPAPTAAINSGKKLDSSLLAADNRISNGQGREYDGSPDNDEDDATLEASRLR